GDWKKAIDIYIHQLPDTLDNRLELAEAQTGAGRASEALKTLQHISSSDARVDLARARAEYHLDHFEKIKAVSRSAAIKARKAGSDQMQAMALYFQGVAEYQLGSPTGALPHFIEAQELFRSVSD
ncbi:MAG TPA: hypothetical protein VGR07_22635, partial [Thermoanaerobaculia bacterium]|nr:hypothetical protein [Thermoanaerobaculia bacterium]